MIELSAFRGQRIRSMLTVGALVELLACLVLLLIVPAHTFADSRSDPAALERLATYSARLGSVYDKVLEMSDLSDSAMSTLEDYRFGTIDEVELRRRYDETAGTLRKAIDALSASVAALPDVPTFRDASQGVKLGVERLADFRSLLLQQPAAFRHEFDLLEGEKAAVLAGDMDAFEKLEREHFAFIAQQIDLETRSLRQQIALSEEHSLGTPLWRIAVETNDATAAWFRWNADADSETLPRTLGAMRDHLGEARVALRAGLRKTAQAKDRFDKLEPRSLKDQELDRLMGELFANLSASYENERRLLETMQDFIDAVEDSHSHDSPADEAAARVEELSIAQRQFVARRLELDAERQKIAARIGAAAK